MMIDWTVYHRDLLSRLDEMAKLSPDTVKGYQGMSNAGARTGNFDAKTRELIAPACAVMLRCDGCITVHTAAAMKSGAKLVYSLRTLDAWAAHTASAAA